MVKSTRAQDMLATKNKRSGNISRKQYKLVCKYCGNEFLSTHKESRYCSRHCSGKDRYKNNNDKNVFENGWNSENAYFLGLILSDGCLTHNKDRNIIVLSMNDLDVISKMHSYVECKRKIYHQGKCSSLYYWNEEAVKFLRNYGLKERKSLSLEYPYNLPMEFMSDFVRGFFDGDGSVVFRNTKYNIYPQVSIVSASYNFIIGLQTVLTNNNIESRVYRDKRNNNIYLKISKIGEVKKIKDFIYYDENVTRMDRKYIKFKKIDNIKTKYNMLPA